MLVRSRMIYIRLEYESVNYGECRPSAEEPGRVYKRCGCRGAETGRQVWQCPKLAESRHGRWYFAVQVSGPDGRRQRVRRGGFATRAEAERACWELGQMP